MTRHLHDLLDADDTSPAWGAAEQALLDTLLARGSLTPAERAESGCEQGEAGNILVDFKDGYLDVYEAQGRLVADRHTY